MYPKYAYLYPPHNLARRWGALVAELQHLQSYFVLNGKEGQIAVFVPQISIT